MVGQAESGITLKNVQEYRDYILFYTYFLSKLGFNYAL